MKNIVALIDFSAITTRILEQAGPLAKALDTRLILLHVVPEEPSVVELGIASPTVFRPASAKKIEADYQALLDLRDSLAAAGVEASAQQMEQAGVEKVLERCRELEAGMIVVGTHHHSVLYQLFVGSFTSDVLKRATCPVLVVPAPDEANG